MLRVKPMRQSWRQLLLIIALFGLSMAAYSKEKPIDKPTVKPIVTTSIHPLALLVAEVAGTEVDLRSMISAGQSPHTYQMRVSDRRRLADSDLIFWVGPALETFLQDLMTQEDLQQKSTALAPAIRPELFGSEHPHHDEPPAHDEPSEQSDEHEHEHAEEEHEDHEAQGEEHHHEHAGADPHIWLEPGLGGEIARVIAAELKKTGMVDNKLIDTRLADFESRLAAADEKIRSRLARRGDATYFTYHDAFRPFAEHYGIEIAGSLTFSPEVQPGARHLSEVRARLRAATNPCVLTEPQFSRQWWTSITEGVDLTISTWDALATDIEPAPGSYTRFLEGLADAFLKCDG